MGENNSCRVATAYTKVRSLNSHSRLIIHLPPCVADDVDFYGFHCNRRKPEAKPLNSMAPPIDTGRYHPVRYPTLYRVPSNIHSNVSSLLYLQEVGLDRLKPRIIMGIWMALLMPCHVLTSEAPCLCMNA